MDPSTYVLVAYWTGVAVMVVPAALLCAAVRFNDDTTWTSTFDALVADMTKGNPIMSFVTFHCDEERRARNILVGVLLLVALLWPLLMGMDIEKAIKSKFNASQN